MEVKVRGRDVCGSLRNREQWVLVLYRPSSSTSLQAASQNSFNKEFALHLTLSCSVMCDRDDMGNAGGAVTVRPCRICPRETMCENSPACSRGWLSEYYM